MGGVVSDAIDVVTGVVGEAVDIVGEGVKTVGKVVDDQLGLDTIGNAIKDAGTDIKQVGGVLSGEYTKRSEEIQNMQKSLNSRTDAYNAKIDSLSERMHSLMAFDQVFKMALGNDLEELTATEGAQIAKMTEEVQALIVSLKHDFDFVIGLTQGPFLQKIIGSVIMIIGGITHDMNRALKGDWDSDLFKRLAVDALIVIGLVLAIPTFGFSLAVVLAMIGAFLTLDGMYANGAATGAIMSCLDFVFNDVLNLDDIVGNDFNKFNKDSDGYNEMVGYTKLALAIGAIYTAWTAPVEMGTAAQMSMNPSTADALRMPSEMEIGDQLTQQAANTPGKELMGGAISWNGKMENSTAFGVKLTTYSDIYKAYTTATNIGDAVTANSQYQDLKSKLEEDKEKVENAIFRVTNDKFVNSYKDVAYFLQDQQEYVDRYVWSMTAQSMYVDPFGTTPVANIRFSPDKDTRMMSFGYEDVFDENKKAGSRGYFNNILYG